jgi:hypothetical protein
MLACNYKRKPLRYKWNLQPRAESIYIGLAILKIQGDKHESKTRFQGAEARSVDLCKIYHVNRSCVAETNPIPSIS